MARPQDTPVTSLRVEPIKKVSTHLEVLHRLGDEIRQGRLRGGDRLPPERQLAEMLQVSRTSLRGGLAVLEAVGLVRSQPGSGPRAGTFMLSEPGTNMNEILSLQVALSHFDVADVVDFRRSIESAAVMRLAADPEHYDLSVAEKLIDESVDAKRPEMFAPYDVDFHVELVRLGSNRLSVYMVQMCRDVLEDRMLAGFKTLDDWDEARELFIDHHRGILDAIRSGDPASAVNALLKHVTGPRGYRQAAEEAARGRERT